MKGRRTSVNNNKEKTDVPLTPREIEVLRLLCEPCSTKEVAARLGISNKTAVSHRTNIMSKAGTHDPISLFRWGIREGYVRPEIPKIYNGSEHEFMYLCVLCLPYLDAQSLPVLVPMICPKHGLCWHRRIAKE